MILITIIHICKKGNSNNNLINLWQRTGYKVIFYDVYFDACFLMLNCLVIWFLLEMANTFFMYYIYN